LKPRLGKVPRSFLERAVLKHLGGRDEAVLQGPKPGVDNAVLRLGGGKVLIVTTDPVSIIPSLGIEESAWLSVHLIASDYATSGKLPEFAIFGYNFPGEVSESQAQSYLESVGDECGRLGIAIVAGNTGRYPGAGLSVVGEGVMLGRADEGEYLLSSMARTGDDIVMTKGAAIETTAALSLAFRNYVEDGIGTKLASRARGYLRMCSVVKDAVIAAGAEAGEEGVTAMHDATEGGVLGGLAEMSEASARDFVIDPGEIFVSKETRALCALFGIDPPNSLSEGTLLVTCRRDSTSGLVRRLRRSGLHPAVIGRVGGRGGRLLANWNGGRKRPIVPRADPYWDAYTKAAEAGLE
jgi:hydrogenase expression/formation protein HypE